MSSVKLLKSDGTQAGSVELSDKVFDAPQNAGLVHEVAVALQNARRQGNAETKTRSEVRGGGRKPFRQKGTGRARQGSSREPQMRGGGAVFGPHKRSYRQKVTPALRRRALCCVLSARRRGDALCVLENLACPEPRTKPFRTLVDAVSPDGKSTLFVTANADRNVLLSSRNLPRVSVTTASDLNALDVLNAGRVILVHDAVSALEARLTPAARQEADS